MPMQPLHLTPGVNTELTQALNTAGVSSSNLIRYESGLPQKMGGWTKFFSSALSAIARCLHGWQDIEGVKHLAVGTSLQLAVITNGSLQDITPQTLVTDGPPDFSTVMGSTTVTIIDVNVSNLTTLDSVFLNTPVSVGGLALHGLFPIVVSTGTNSYEITAPSNATSTVNHGGAVPQFTTVSGSAVVTVTFNAHGLSAGSIFTFPIATTANGVTIVGSYPVNSIVNVNQFTITASSQASASSSFFMNSSNAELLYYINLGPLPGGSGYGIGGYGEGGYGTGITPTGATGIPITTTDWSLDNWGSFLIANPRGGGLYYWDPNGGFQNAALISQGPIFNNGCFVAMPQQILVAWGSIATGEQQDPLTVRWSDILNFFNWEVTSGSQAGSFRIPNGSEIRGAIQAPTQALIFTDIGVWAMQYVNYPLVWGFNNIGQGCGLVGPHAVTILQQTVYWVSDNNFFALGGGGVIEIPCTVWDVIFQDLDRTNLNKIVLGANSAFGELICFYPSASGGTGEIDSYVMYHASESASQGRPVWTYGTAQSFMRTAWIDQSVFGQPIGASPTRLIYQHELTMDADGSPMDDFFETGWFALAEGQQQTFIDQFWPDCKWRFFNGTGSANIQVFITTAEYPNSVPVVNGPFTMNDSTTFIGARCRGKLAKIMMLDTGVGTFWRLGNTRFRMANSGRR